MVTSYYTLLALARSWADRLTGLQVEEVFSQERGELTLALLDGAEASMSRASMLKASVQAPLHYVFSSEGYHRARRNVATLFEAAVGRRLTAVRLAERDRFLYLDLDDGSSFHFMLFGPRANVFLVDPSGTVAEAFRGVARLLGKPPPTPRPAPRLDDFAAFEARWKDGARTTAQAVAAALPLFDRTMAAEAVHRSGLEVQSPAACGEAERRALFRAALAVRSALEAPSPRIYWRDGQADTFSLCPLRHLSDCDEEVFDDVEAAVRVYVRRSLGQRRFDALYAPLEKALSDARAHYERRTEVMLEELANESRADRYERWGHLLMASPGAVPRGADRVELPDLFAGGEATTIPLDPLLGAVGNAQRYYDKARTTRQARAHAEGRLVASEQRGEEAAALLEALRGLTTVRDVERFKKQEAERLAKYLGQRADTEDRIPFRRYELEGGYEVWVGRDARQNDQLTFHHARKYDLWMHARGTPGSHTVLRLPARTAEPPPALLERAAAIAAYYSKARGSSLVPVIVVPRKYVRKPRGAAPGAVVVEREQVLLVAPELPE